MCVCERKIERTREIYMHEGEKEREISAVRVIRTKGSIRDRDSLCV